MEHENQKTSLSTGWLPNEKSRLQLDAFGYLSATRIALHKCPAHANSKRRALAIIFFDTDRRAAHLSWDPSHLSCGISHRLVVNVDCRISHGAEGFDSSTVVLEGAHHEASRLLSHLCQIPFHSLMTCPRPWAPDTVFSSLTKKCLQSPRIP